MFPSSQPVGPRDCGPQAVPPFAGDAADVTDAVEGDVAAAEAGPAVGEDAADGGQDLAALPEAVRDRITELAAAALGKLSAVDIPRQLRPVARFAPAKRARLGGPALLAALRESSPFRTAVLEWLREHRHDALNPNAEDAVGAAAAAVLLGEADAAGRVRLVARHAQESTLRAERDAAYARTQRLEAELTQARAELDEARGAAERVRGEREDELDRLRGRLREQGVHLRRARDAAEVARAEAASSDGKVAAEIEALTAQVERERVRAAAERARADRAVAEAENARQSAREARRADEVRLALLVDTLDGVADGLRRELSLTGDGPRPADLVAGRSGGGAGDRVTDAAGLDQLLTLPGVHLIVDGYNVTKTGYPELVLADQRDRLVRQLGALAARIRVEVTVVFDGAGVLSVPAAGPRGVRVLFSDKGVLADDLIRTLVAAEPKGRPLVVASTDREVADSVRERGANPVPSAVLLDRLGRG